MLWEGIEVISGYQAHSRWEMARLYETALVVVVL